MSAPWWDSDSKDRSAAENRVHVGNLPWGTDDRSLKDAFASYGPRSAEVSGYSGRFLLDTVRCFFSCITSVYSRFGWICACVHVSSLFSRYRSSLAAMFLLISIRSAVARARSVLFPCRQHWAFEDYDLHQLFIAQMHSYTNLYAWSIVLLWCLTLFLWIYLYVHPRRRSLGSGFSLASCTLFLFPFTLIHGGARAPSLICSLIPNTDFSRTKGQS
jgi:RNA recognition motif-containing protein